MAHRCRRSVRTSLRGAAKALLLVLNSCAAFMSAVVLSAGLLVGSAESYTVTAHMWTRVKTLQRYIGYTSVQFSSDTAYQTCFSTPANILAVIGLSGLLLSLGAIACALCGSRLALQAVATVTGLCLAGTVGLAAAVAAGSSLTATAKSALATQALSWIAAYQTTTSGTSANVSTGADATVARFGGVFLDYLQLTRRCCGWNSYRDYPAAVFVPASCCQLDSGGSLGIQQPLDLNCLVANSSLGWYGNGCGGLFDDLLTRYLPDLALAAVMLLLSTAAAVTMACLTSTGKDFVRLLREAAME